MTTSWTNIPKPSNTSSTLSLTYSGGDPVGMLMAITHSSVIGIQSVMTSTWTDVPKPVGTGWSNVVKAT